VVHERFDNNKDDDEYDDECPGFKLIKKNGRDGIIPMVPLSKYPCENKGEGCPLKDYFDREESSKKQKKEQKKQEIISYVEQKGKKAIRQLFDS